MRFKLALAFSLIIGAPSFGLFTSASAIDCSKATQANSTACAAKQKSGAEEVNDLGETLEIVSDPSDLISVRNALQNAKLDYDSAESSFLPSVSVPLDAEGAKKVFSLIEAIEDCDDVQNVYGNFDISDEVMAAL